MSEGKEEKLNKGWDICLRCGKPLREHHAFLISAPPPDSVEGQWEGVETRGLYCSLTDADDDRRAFEMVKEAWQRQLAADPAYVRPESQQ
jgi:hypothetical protein